MVWYYRYVKGLIIPPSGKMTLGKSFHTSVEMNYEHKKEKEKDLKLSVTQDIFHEKFTELSKDTKWEDNEKPSDLEKVGIDKLLPTFHEKLAPKTYPKDVEIPFLLEFKEREYVLRGRIDLITKEERIVDYKTSGRKPNNWIMHTNLQIPCYSLGYRHLYNDVEKEIALDYICYSKTKKTEVVKRALKGKEVRTKRMLMIIDSVANAIKEGRFHPNEGSSYLCSPQWCGYWGLCKRGEWKIPNSIPEIVDRKEGK